MWMQNFSWSCVLVTHRPKNPATPPRGNLYFGHIHKLTHQSQMFTTRNSAENFTKKKKCWIGKPVLECKQTPWKKYKVLIGWTNKTQNERLNKSKPLCGEQRTTYCESRPQTHRKKQLRFTF